MTGFQAFRLNIVFITCFKLAKTVWFQIELLIKTDFGTKYRYILINL